MVAIGLMSLIGWVVATKCLGKWIGPDSRLYFAPALGMAVCAIIAYVACATRHMRLVPFFTFIALGTFLVCVLRKEFRWPMEKRAQRIFNFTLLTFICLFGMQLAVFHLFKTIYPGPHEVWDVYNLTGTPPPDQMFAWHQALFFNLHRNYPEDMFYGDIDLYDRPYLGGYLTLFFFRLFHLPLGLFHLGGEYNYAYPAMALRFYHCFWWGLNNLYLFGIAGLFQRLLGYRGAVLAVTSSAVSGFIFLCNMGGWMKFAALYPFLLAVLLFLSGKGPLLQAGLCATSFYLHGSILPFLLGFGILQILCRYYPILPTLARFKDVAWFALGGVVSVGAWFAVVKWVGSKQPLFYFYVYDANLTQAQTEPVAQIAKAFYAKHSWSSLSFLPLYNLSYNIFPVHVFAFLKSFFSSSAPWKASDLATTIFQSQQNCVSTAAGVAALPVIILGFIKTLSRRYAGRIILVLYLIPSLLIGFVYRKDRIFCLHIICLYHTFVLFLWVWLLRNTRLIFVILGLTAITVEGVICVLFSDWRFVPVNGIRWSQLITGNWIYLGIYLFLLLVILTAAYLELRRLGFESETNITAEWRGVAGNYWLVAGRKLFAGLLITALAIGIYSLYCLRFY